MTSAIIFNAAEKSQVRRLLDRLARATSMCAGCGRKVWFVVAKEQCSYVAVDDDAVPHDPECKGPLRATRRVGP